MEITCGIIQILFIQNIVLYMLLVICLLSQDALTIVTTVSVIKTIVDILDIPTLRQDAEEHAGAVSKVRPNVLQA